MKTRLLKILLMAIGWLAFIPRTYSQDIGATFCWHYQEIYGGHDYSYNQSIAKKELPDSTNWTTTTEWWENMAEEVDYSGIDFIALLSRGNQPNAPDRGNGNPKHIPKLIDAMNARGSSFKLAIFDDCPNSWTGSKNWNESGGTTYSTSSPKFDCSNTANYKYIWDYNLKQAIGNIPDAKRYKIDGRMVIFFWSVKPTWMSNTQGHLSEILQYIRDKCQATYGFIPYIIIDKDWLDNDSTLSTATVDAVHGWFSAANGISYTLETWNGKKTGALAPGFSDPANPPYLDPSMGTSDKGLRLKTGLDHTVGAGARTTLVEGFTDAAEAAALWRSTDNGTNTFHAYANQRLNILRRYTSDPYPSSLKMEVEACDINYDLTAGNSGGAFLDLGDLDVVKCNDTNGGWNVTATQANEWMEWKELPLLKNTKFQLRYKSTTGSSIKFSVDGTALTTVSLPSTSGVWTTINAGNYTTGNNSLHTVRLTIVSGSPDINYFKRVDGTIAVTGVTVTPSTAALSVGNTKQLIATVAPSNATNSTVTWSSNNTAAVTVNSSGLVTAIASGTATITVTTQDGGKTDTSVITVTTPSTGSQTYQAEDANYNGAIVASNQTGYNGTGFIDFVNDTGDYIQWTVNVPTAGKYDLSFRYALPNGGRPLELKVNGTVKEASLDFPATSLWNNWQYVTSTQTLNAGNNTIRLSTNGSNGGNIDELSVIPYLDDCDALANWLSASANTLTYNTTDKKQGTGCLQMVGSATDEFKRSFPTPLNTGVSIANGILSFWYYVSDVTKCGTVRVELGSGGAADVDELSWPLSGLANGWNHIILNTVDAVQAGTPNMNALNWFRIYNPKTGSITTRLDAVRILDSASGGNSLATISEPANLVINGLDLQPNTELQSATIYPNPYKDGLLSIDLKGFKKLNDIKIKLVNIAGQTLQETVVKNSSHVELDLSGKLKESVYLIYIEAGNTRVVKKLVVN
nr:DUF5010 domain-containing protein [uncultured Pedobacter sp.]